MKNHLELKILNELVKWKILENFNGIASVVFDSFNKVYMRL